MSNLWRNSSGDLMRKPDGDVVRQASCPDCDCIFPCNCPCGTYPPASWPCSGLLETYSLTAWTHNGTFPGELSELRIDPTDMPVTLTASGSCVWSVSGIMVQESFNGGSWQEWFGNTGQAFLKFKSGHWALEVSGLDGDFSQKKNTGCDPVGSYTGSTTYSSSSGTIT